MMSFGYNTAAMAQRYFSVDDERSARKVALLCFAPVPGSAPSSGSSRRWPCACCTRTCTAVWPGLANPARVLVRGRGADAAAERPGGDHAGRDVQRHDVEPLRPLQHARRHHLQGHLPAALPAARRASGSCWSWAGWPPSAVGATMIALAMGMAASGQSVFEVMLTFNTVMSLAYGPPGAAGPGGEDARPAGRGCCPSRWPGARLLRQPSSAHWGLVRQRARSSCPTSVAVFFAARPVEPGRPRHTSRGARASSGASTRRSTWRASWPAAPTRRRGLPLPEPGHRGRRPAEPAADLRGRAGRAGRRRLLRPSRPAGGGRAHARGPRCAARSAAAAAAVERRVTRALAVLALVSRPRRREAGRRPRVGGERRREGRARRPGEHAAQARQLGLGRADASASSARATRSWPSR